jgi:hypothetical protein
MTTDTDSKSAIAESIHKASIDLLMIEGEEYATALLLSCNLDFDAWSNSNGAWGYNVSLSGPPALYQVLRNIEGLAGGWRSGMRSKTAETIRDALSAAISSSFEEDSYLEVVRLVMEPDPPYPGWRDAYAAQLRGDAEPSNQAVVGPKSPAFTWNGLGFRSRTEQVLAEAFSRNGVLFFPLAAAVSRTQKYEPDFLVCNGQGKWGILEVHGDDFHPPETAAQEHERGRWFQERGVRFFQVFNATDCFNNSDAIVDRFLKLLAAS